MTTRAKSWVLLAFLHWWCGKCLGSSLLLFLGQSQITGKFAEYGRTRWACRAIFNYHDISCACACHTLHWITSCFEYIISVKDSVTGLKSYITILLLYFQVTGLTFSPHKCTFIVCSRAHTSRSFNWVLLIPWMHSCKRVLRNLVLQNGFQEHSPMEHCQNGNRTGTDTEREWERVWNGKHSL